MCSGSRIKKPHKTRIENCRGTLRDPREAYGKWAYWRLDDRGRFGWFATPSQER